MARAVGAWVFGLLATTGALAQPLVLPGAMARGRERMTLGDPLGAAAAFHEALKGRGAGLYTVRVGVYCDAGNLERRARAVGNPPELFVLRRSVSGRTCLALFWGLFPSRTAARAAVGTVPVPLRAPGQSAVAVADVLPPGEPPSPRAAAPPPPSPPAEAPATPPASPPSAAPEAAPALPEAPLAAEPPAPKPREAPPAQAAPPTPEGAPLEPPAAEAPEPAAAEPAALPGRYPALEATVGWSGLWDDAYSKGGRDGFFELGWMLSLCGNLSRSIGVVGEASGHYSSEDTLDPSGAPLAVDRDLLGVHAGLRYTYRGRRRLAGYAQALAGWTRSGVEQSGRRDLEDAFSVQPGLGVLVRVSPTVGFAAGADYRLVLGEEQPRGEVRFHVGLVLSAGER